MRALLVLMMMVLFAGVARAETAPRKVEAAPKKAPAATKAAQPAATTPVPPFDHAKTGFLLRDVHTTLRCEQCHVDGVFKNTPKDCAGCHSVGSRVAATPRPVNHVQTTQPCDTCHTSPTTFLVASFKHIGVTSNCTTCHNGQSLGVVSKPANHFPTLMPCENCHNTTTFSTARMNHTGITSGCSNCHLGQFAGVVSKPAAHIVTSGDCGVCHNTTTFLGATYDHSTVAAGTCGTCHLGQQSGVVAKPAVHVPTLTTGNACDACHTATNTSGYTSFLGAMYHQSATAPSSAGICSTCHTGQFPSVLGKTPTHIPTTAQCDTCHTSTNTANFTTFLGATYTHATPPGVCSTCHNGISATGKTPTHIFTSTDCGNCHTQTNTANYTTFLGAAYTHSPNPPVAGTCAGCHNGSTATGKPVYHIPTTASCETCHTQSNTANYTTFLGAIYTHPNPPGVCSTCHNGTSAKGKSATHVVTTAPCDTCHTQTNTANYTTFLGATYVHATPPGVCSTCHNGVTAKGKPATHVATNAACNLCHTQTNTANYTTFLGATYTHATPPGVCATCHNGVTALGKPANHLATTLACDACHTQANTSNFTTFLGASSVDHSTIAAGTCATCHNGSQATGKTAGHIPTGSLSCDSGGCHQKYNGTTVLTFLPGTMQHSVVTGIGCSICHGGAYTTQGLQYGGAQTKPSNHIPTTITTGLECTTCHRSPIYTSSTGWSSELMNHNNAQGMGSPIYCVTCHLSGNTYLGSMRKFSHNGASTAKDCSSSSCHKPLGRIGTVYLNWN